jgi:hypothetical protein
MRRRRVGTNLDRFLEQNGAGIVPVLIPITRDIRPYSSACAARQTTGRRNNPSEPITRCSSGGPAEETKSRKLNEHFAKASPPTCRPAVVGNPLRLLSPWRPGSQANKRTAGHFLRWSSAAPAVARKTGPPSVTSPENPVCITAEPACCPSPGTQNTTLIASCIILAPLPVLMPVAAPVVG